jgi:hypothetical protein
VFIAERKQRLMSIFGNVAEMAAERMEELAGQASLRDAGTTAGIATDKLLALSSDPFSQANQQHLYVHLDKSNAINEWNNFVKAHASHQSCDVRPEASAIREASAGQKQISAKDIISEFNQAMRKLASSASEAKDTAVKALPCGPDPEATQPTATTRSAEGCAREETDSQKESYPVVDRNAQGINSNDSPPEGVARRSDCRIEG